MKSGKVMFGILVGVATGTVIGILFAPEKGSKTRKQILSKGEEYADALQEKFDDLVETITNKYENTRDDAEEFVAVGKAKFDQLKKDSKSINA